MFSRESSPGISLLFTQYIYHTQRKFVTLRMRMVYPFSIPVSPACLRLSPWVCS